MMRHLEHAALLRAYAGLPRSHAQWHSICFLMVCLCVTSLASADHVVHVPAEMRPELRAAVGDLESLLVQITGNDVELVADHESNGEAVTIRLARAASAAEHLEPDLPLADRNDEAYWLYTQPDGPIWIVGQTDNAIANGVYDYLERLGVRWLLPSERWTVVPKRTDIRIQVNDVDEPQYLSRNFFGTGGFGGILPVDQNHEMRDAWADWKRRMRFGGTVQLAGHSFEGFNHAQRETLEANPDYRAMVDGERVPWSLGMKLCYTNPEVVELFTQNRLNVLSRAVEADPQGPRSFAVSVDPSDGGGHCTCQDCLALGTVSDRVFTLANHVARAVQEQFPGRHVSLYAYNEHAMVPNIDLEPNVYVMLVPYAFQRTGLAPERFIGAWAEKVDHLAIYGYWGVTDWSMGRPTFSLNHDAVPQLQTWSDHGVDVMALESCTSAGAMGWLFYITGHMIWDEQLTADTALRAWCSDAFDEAAEPMHRLFSRWAERYLPSAHELGLCYRDLQEADALASRPDVRARIADVARYVHFLRLHFEYEQQPPKSSERLVATRALIGYLWRTYDSRMMQPYRLFQLLANRHERHASDQLNASWPLRDHDAPVWAQLEPYTDEQVERLVEDGANRYKPRDFEERRYHGPFVALRDMARLNTSPEHRLTTTMLYGHIVHELLIPNGMQTLAFDFKAGPRPASYPGDAIELLDPQGNIVDKTVAPADGQWHEIQLSVPAPGRYTLTVYDQKAFCYLKLPPVVHATRTSPLVSASLQPRLYFYVPRGLERLAFYEASVIPFKLMDPSGQTVDLKGQTGLIVVDVPKGQAGKLWSLQGYKSYTPLQFLNVPQAVSLSPHAILLPESALK